MRAEEIDRELIAANPWWRDPDWQNGDVQLRRAATAPFEHHPDVLDRLDPGGLYVVRGPRRVGKSTELKRAIARGLDEGVPARQVVHMSVEGWRVEDLVHVVHRAADHWLRGEDGQRAWFIDEITAVHGDWPSAIKRLRDGHASFANDTVVLTGSSGARFDEATKQLAGRRNCTDSDRVLLQMPFGAVGAAMGRSWPESPSLTVAELADADRVAAEVDALRPWVPEIVAAWETYLVVGGYPQSVARYLDHAEHEDPALMAALWDVTHGDALARGGLAQTQTQALLRGVSSSLTSLLSGSAVAQKVDVSPDAARARLEDLRRSFLAFPVHREQGLAPRPSAQAKWYFTDPLLARLAAWRGAGTEPSKAALSEQQLGVGLLRKLEQASSGAAIAHDRLLYYRSSTRAEIDFVAEAFRGVCVESKYVDARWGRAFQTVEASPFGTGIVATRSGLERHEGGWALPAGLVAHLLGV